MRAPTTLPLRVAATLLLAVATLGWASRDTASKARSAETRLTVARLQYDGGGDWYANPSSLPNLLAAISERT